MKKKEQHEQEKHIKTGAHKEPSISPTPETKEKNDEVKEKKKPEEEGSGQELESDLLKKALEEKTKEAASHYESLLRVRAEFENFKKRQAKENSQFLKYANESLVKSLFPVLNNLERANNAAKANQDTEALRVGVEMILNMFYDVLKQANVKPVESAGQPFDPAMHEVISCVESADHEENTILEEFEKGYLLHDRLLCPAKVVVSKKPASP